MRHSLSFLAVTCLALSACAGVTGPVILGVDAGIMYVTRPDKPPPADTADQIPPHESWCYSTMGNTECYAHPQDVPPSRLVNVDPPSRYPVDLQAYHDALYPPKPPVTTTVVETTAVVTPAPAVVVPAAPVVVSPPQVKAPESTLSKKKKHSKHHKKPVPPKTAGTPSTAAPANPTVIAPSVAPAVVEPPSVQREKDNLTNEINAP